MPSTGFNFFVVILGFLLLGLPIILISITTAPPSPETYASEIIFNYPDQTAFAYLNQTAKINGSSSYWDDIKSSAPLSNIYNISDLIKKEENFRRTANTSDYTGLSKNVHIFHLNLSIYITNSEMLNNINQIYFNHFATNNHSTFCFYLNQLDEYDAYYYKMPSYPSETDAINSIVSTHNDIYYLALVSFKADVDYNGQHITTTFERLLLLTNKGQVLIFITNE